MQENSKNKPERRISYREHLRQIEALFLDSKPGAPGERKRLEPLSQEWNKYSPFADMEIHDFSLSGSEPFLHLYGEISDDIEERAYRIHSRRMSHEDRQVGWKFSAFGYYVDIPLERFNGFFDGLTRQVSRSQFIPSLPSPQSSFPKKKRERGLSALAFLDRARKALNEWKEFAQETERAGQMKDLEDADRQSEYRFVVGRQVEKINQALSHIRFPVLLNPDSPRYEGENLLEANLFIAASPFRMTRTQIAFLPDLSVSDEEEEERDKWLFSMVGARTLSFLHLNAALSTQFPTLEVSLIRHYNVGQGNFSIGYPSEKDGTAPSVIFDMGFTKEEEHSPYSSSVAVIQNLDNNGVVILSHYDLDHILGAIYAPEGPNGPFMRTWILPTITSKNKRSARNLVLYLLWKNPDRVFFVPDGLPSPGYVAQVGNIGLFQGNGSSTPERCSYENVRGLISLVKKDKTCLLPGDCITPCFPQIFSHLDYFLIPHHGCSSRTMNVSFAKEAQAMVFVGPNGHHHPVPSTLLDIHSRGVTIHQFNNVGVLMPPCHSVRSDTFDFVL